MTFEATENPGAVGSPVECAVGRLVPERAIVAAPRVEACIEAVMARHPGASIRADARYYEAVHQELAPLARELEVENNRICEYLGCVEQDAHTDPVDVIKMIQGWEVDAQRRAELLEQHLRAVLAVARTWQPDYATKMDRDTLQHAEDFADCKTPNVGVERLPACADGEK